MSARATLAPRRAALRSSLTDYLYAAGVPALVSVVAGGASLGFFVWYGFISHVYVPGGLGRGLIEFSFALAVPGGIVAAVALWNLYSRYFARRADITLVTALRTDAVAWGLLVLFWLTFLRPFGASATGRSVALGLGAFALAKLLAAVRYNQTVREVAITFVTTRVSIILIAELAAVIIGQRPGTHISASANPALAVWGRWDAVHYLDIAAKGYYGTDMAFFPLYPSLVALLGIATGNHLIAGLLISNVALFFGLLYLYKLVEHQYSRQVAQRSVFYVSIFPTAIFFSAVYTEALFFALTVASFYYIRERKWLLAGAIGFFAALTRVEGVLLAVPFALEWLLSLGETWKVALRRPFQEFVLPIVGLALVPLGILAYMGYLWLLRGDPLYFSHVQAHWNRRLAPPWQSFIHSFNVIAHSHDTLAVTNQIIELGFTLLMLGVLVAGFRRVRPSYWIYMALSIVVPMSTSSLMSMPRFALVLFPMFVIFAVWGANRAFNNAIVAFSLPLLGLFTVLFADWYWVA